MGLANLSIRFMKYYEDLQGAINKERNLHDIV